MVNKIFQKLILFTTLSFMFFSCELGTMDVEENYIDGQIISQETIEYSSRAVTGTKSLSAYYEKNPSGNRNDRKIVLTVYIKDNRYIQAKVQNYKRHWIGSSWNSYETQYHIYKYGVEVKSTEGIILHPYNTSGNPYIESGTGKEADIRIGYIGRYGHTYTAWLTRCHVTATNDGVGNNFAVINGSYPLPSFNAYISGPTSAALQSTQTWTASAVNATAPVTYKWSVKSNLAGQILYTGTSQSITGTLNIPGEWTVTLIASSDGTTITRTKTVTVPYY